MSRRYLLLQWLLALTFAQLPPSIVRSSPVYNPLTGCHDLTSPDEGFTFALCLQRASNKQHPFHLLTAPLFCSQNYPPYGRLVDISILSLSTIDLLFQNLTNLFIMKDAHIALPAPNFLWINSNFTLNKTNEHLWCPSQCQGKNQSGKLLTLKLRCQWDNNSKPCLTSRHTHWDRAPFICFTNQTIQVKKQTASVPVHVPPSYSNDTIVFYDSSSCVIARTRTHQYTFCFRRQSCPQTLTSAFCTTKSSAYQICQEDKHASGLLTIENDEEYQLVNKIISEYAVETLLDVNGSMKNKYIARAQWMWIDGVKGFNDGYQWNVSGNFLTPIPDTYWCNQMSNCSGGKGRDHVVLNVACQSDGRALQACLASRRESEPGPFICKRLLTENEEPAFNYTFLKNSTVTPTPVIPAYEKNSTFIYYDEHHCLTVQTQFHLYSFCLRRQNCTLKQAYCTKWSEAQKDCRTVKSQAQLLTIENDQERMLVTDVMSNYLNETRLTFNGSSYRYYELADFIWIDGIQQADNQTYVWGKERESIPEHLWCPKDECKAPNYDRVMLSLVCNKNHSSACLGTRREWHPAPYICKRTRPTDHCPMPFDQLNCNQSSEMLIVTVNRTIALVKCKHPDYNTEIRVEYHCDREKNQWELIYENDNFTCPDYEPPTMAASTSASPSTSRSTTLTSTRPTYPIRPNTSPLQIADCSQSELSLLMANLPTESRHIVPTRLPSYSSLYYNVKLTCYFNQSIQIIYRCDLVSKRWMYVYGSTNQFQMCSQPCNNSERAELLNKFFTRYEQSQIQTKYLRRRNQLRLRCLNTNENRRKTILYTCGTMSITKYQWFEIHSCFQSFAASTQLPPVMVSMSVTQLPRACPPAVPRGSPCEYTAGQYIFDVNGCTRKVCPSLSRLCATIRCPSDRICRVIPCKECVHSDYLQAVCEYPPDDHSNTNTDDDLVIVDMTLNITIIVRTGKAASHAERFPVDQSLDTSHHRYCSTICQRATATIDIPMAGFDD